MNSLVEPVQKSRLADVVIHMRYEKWEGQVKL